MSLKAPTDDPHRFTLTDYEYDTEEPVANTSGSASASGVDKTLRYSPYESPSRPNAEAGSSRTGYSNHILSPAPEIVASSPLPAAVISERRREKQGSGSSIGSATGSGPAGSTKGKLRLHQASDRPVYTTATSSSSVSAHPLSPSSSVNIDYHLASPTSFEIRPLPSIPRSFSSTSNSHLDAYPPNSPPIPSGSGAKSPPPLPHSPSSPVPLTPATPGIERTPSPSAGLSPPPMPNRNSDVSGTWSAHQMGFNGNEKDIETGGAPVLNRGVSTSKVVRWWDKIFPSSWSCRLLLLTVVLETIVDLTIEGNILWRFNQEIDHSDGSSILYRRMPIYLVIYGLAHLWQLVLTVVAVRTKNTVQITAVTAFNFAFLAYAVMQIFELRQILGDDLADSLTSPREDGNTSLLTLPLNVLTAIVIAVVATGCVVLLILSYCIRREFGWQRYRFLGADLQIRKYYLRFQVYECICYFSAFFCAGFGIQFIWLVLQKTDSEYIITWVAFPVLILLLVLGRFAAKYENRIAMGVFMAGLVVSWAYFIFKLVRVWQQENTTFHHLTKSLTGFAVLSLVSLIACFGWGIRVWMDFGKGLKEAVLTRPKSTSLHSFIGLWSTRSKTSEMKPEITDPAQRRISID